MLDFKDSAHFHGLQTSIYIEWIKFEEKVQVEYRFIISICNQLYNNYI